MSPRSEKAYNALVKAFFEGTLQAGNCTACACGNIIAEVSGLVQPIIKSELRLEDYKPWIQARLDWWGQRIVEVANGQATYIPRKLHAMNINIAGFTAKEFAQIETAFENATSIKYDEYPAYKEQEILEDQYNGLCAVVDVLLQLDEENTSAEPLKANFRQHPKLQTA